MHVHNLLPFESIQFFFNLKVVLTKPKTIGKFKLKQSCSYLEPWMWCSQSSVGLISGQQGLLITLLPQFSLSFLSALIAKLISTVSKMMQKMFCGFCVFYIEKVLQKSLIKPHSAAWISPTCAAATTNRNHIYNLDQLESLQKEFWVY